MTAWILLVYLAGNTAPTMGWTASQSECLQAAQEVVDSNEQVVKTTCTEVDNTQTIESEDNE